MSYLELPRLCVDKIIKNNGDPYDQSNTGPRRIDQQLRIRRKYWNAGQILSIRFLSGDPIVQRKVKQRALDWTTYANLKINFISDGDSDIRIDFQPNGSWSYIGTDAKDIPQNEATMNFGWLQKDTQDREYYIVLHEFGHALGLIHEVQHPQNGIPWNKEAVYNYFSSAPYYWNREMVDNEIFERYSRTYSNSSLFDSRFIMVYHIPQEFITYNKYYIPWNTYLSQQDNAVIQEIYPHTIKEDKISKDDKQPITQSDDPLQILKSRFARGEISKHEFFEMRRILES